MASQGWIIGPPGQASPPPAPEDSSVDLGKGWKVSPQPSAAPAPVGGSTAGGRADTSGAPPLPKGLTVPNWRPGQELPEDEGGDQAPFWDTAEQRQAAEAYNRELDRWKANAPTPPGAQPTAPGPRILAEQPAPPPAPLDVYTRKPGTQTYAGPEGRTYTPPPEETTGQTIQRFLLSPPPVIQDAVKELDRIMVGPFQIIQKGIIEPAAGMVSPAGAATAVVGGGLGAAAASQSAGTAAAGKAANAALSVFFTGLQGKQLVKEVPAAYDLFQKGDYWGALGQLGAAGTSAILGTLAAMHAGGQLSDVATIAATKRALQERLNAQEAYRAAGERAEAGRAAANRPRLPAPEPGTAPPPPSPPPSPAQPVEPAPAPSPAPAAAAPTDLGEGWTSNPIEDAIAEQRRAAIQERQARNPQPPAASANQPPAAVPLGEGKPNVPPEFLPAPVAQQPQTVTASEGTQDLGKGWKAAPEPPEPQKPKIPKEFLPASVAPTAASSEQPVAGPDVPTAAAGKPAEVYTITGRKVNVQYDVRDASDLTNSFQPGYPQEYQPRKTDRAASQQRVNQRKGDLNFDLMADSRLASDGAPITLPDGATITRNHGTEALKQLYAEGSPRAEAYKQDLIDRAPDYGLDPQRVAAIPNPVLTRVITDPMKPADVAQFAEEANMSSAARMSDAGVASVLSRRMTGPLMDSFEPKEDGTPNPEFVRELIKGLPVEEQGAFMDSTGKLSQTGARIVRNTIFAKAYPDPRALERMAESENPSLKNVTAGMLAAAPKVAQFQEAVARGDRFDVGLGREISDAAAVLDELHRTGMTVAHWTAQGDLAGQERDPVVQKLVQIFAEHRRSGQKIGDVLKEYTEVANEAGSPKQESMFGASDPLSKASILDVAYERAKQRWEPKKDLFGDKEAVQPAGESPTRGNPPRENAPEGPQRGPGEEGRPARAGEPEVAPPAEPNEAAAPQSPGLSAKVEPPPESGGERLPTSLPDLLAAAKAQRVPRSGAQLADTLRVNAHAGEVLRRAYKLGGGDQMRSFEGAAAQSAHVRTMLKGLDTMAHSPNLKPGIQNVAANLGGELRKASASGLKPVAIAEPGAETHEHLHFAVDRVKFDPDSVLTHPEMRLAVTRARLSGLAHGSDERVIREVITRIANREHDTLRLDDDTAERVLKDFLANSVHDEAGLDTLKELAHEQFKGTISTARGSDNAGEVLRTRQELGAPPDNRPRSGRGGGDGRVAPPAGGETGEGPEISGRNLDLFPGEEDNAKAEQSARDRLLHDQLTAQLKSGGQVKASKLKPAETENMFEEEKPRSGNLLGSERGSLSLKSIQKTPEQVNAEAEKQYGKNEVWHYTGQRDLWSARVRQITGRLRREIPSAVDREGLYLMRDSRVAPGELEQWLAGTHVGYASVPDVTIAQANIRKLRAAIERALNPTPAMLDADMQLTQIAKVSLHEGQKLGFIDKHVSPDEYVTHLLRPADEEKEEGVADRLGRALGGKIGRNFPYNQEREFPTILEAIANNQRPRTLDPFKAFEIYGDKFATARATYMFLQRMGERNTGVWATEEDAPKGWVEMAAHARLFQKGAQRFFVPQKIEHAFRPITDPDYMARFPGFTKARNYQIFTKAAQLSMSFFHATAETAMALGNMGPTGYWKALRADRFSPEFEHEEAWYIAHGLTTAIQKGAPGMEEGLGATGPLTLSSLPTPAEAIRSLPGIRLADKTAHAITQFTFENQQRRFKVTDMAIHEAAWIAKHPMATRAELDTALRSMAKEVNAIYGGLHWENLGVNKMAVNVARLLQLAPDWWWSNILNTKYAVEGSTPAGKMARMFWIRTLVGGLLLNQLLSLLFSGHVSKRPTMVYLGLDKDGNEIYQNIVLRGAAGQLANALANIIEYGGVEGPLRTIGQSAGPGFRAWNESQKNETFLGREIAPKGMNPLASTARGAIEMGKSLLPFPWSFANAWEMLAGPDADKYQKKELLTTLFAGTPPQHVKPSKPPGTARDIWDQIKTGKVNEPRQTSPTPNSVIEHMKREQRKLLHP